MPRAFGNIDAEGKWRIKVCTSQFTTLLYKHRLQMALYCCNVRKWRQKGPILGISNDKHLLVKKASHSVIITFLSIVKFMFMLTACF